MKLALRALVVSALSIFTPLPQTFAAPAVSTVTAQVVTYDQLVQAIREARAGTRTRIEQAVEQEKVREAWEIGKLIDEHILLHKERADYGKRVLKRLSADLETSDSELYYMLEFARSYPIFPQGGKLSWSHYKALLDMSDPKQREEMAREAVRQRWGRDELRAEVRKRNARIGAPVEDTEPLVPLKGELDTYRVVIAPAGKFRGKPVLDLGFSNYYRPRGPFDFRERDIVSVVGARLPRPLNQGGETPPLQILKPAGKSLVPFHVFSYRAWVLDVTDGDTLWVLVDLGFGITTKQHVRLRGLDAPEIETAEGQEAKRFVESVIARSRGSGDEAISAPVVITTVKSDKYDRYLVDVWSDETYLNQNLLDEGLAVRVSE